MLPAQSGASLTSAGKANAEGLILGVREVYGDHGQENRNYYISIYWGFIGIMENKMATTVVFELGIQAQPYSSVFNEADLHSGHSTVVPWTSLLALF